MSNKNKSISEEINNLKVPYQDKKQSEGNLNEKIYKKHLITLNLYV